MLLSLSIEIACRLSNIFDAIWLLFVLLKEFVCGGLVAVLTVANREEVLLVAVVILLPAGACRGCGESELAL